MQTHTKCGSTIQLDHDDYYFWIDEYTINNEHIKEFFELINEIILNMKQLNIKKYMKKITQHDWDKLLKHNTKWSILSISDDNIYTIICDINDALICISEPFLLLNNLDDDVKNNSNDENSKTYYDDDYKNIIRASWHNEICWFDDYKCDDMNKFQNLLLLFISDMKIKKIMFFIKLIGEPELNDKHKLSEKWEIVQQIEDKYIIMCDIDNIFGEMEKILV